jgi:hypothetical protein
MLTGVMENCFHPSSSDLKMIFENEMGIKCPANSPKTFQGHSCYISYPKRSKMASFTGKKDKSTTKGVGSRYALFICN